MSSSLINPQDQKKDTRISSRRLRAKKYIRGNDNSGDKTLMLRAGIVRGPHPEESDETMTGQSEPSQTESSESVGTDNLAQGDSGDKKTLSEESVEKAFQSAVDDLYKFMLKASSKSKFPEAFTLKNCQNLDDVAAMVGHLDTEIERFNSEQDLKLSSDCANIWKTCAKNWFSTAFPLIKSAGDIAFKAIPSPFSIVAEAIMFLFESFYNAIQRSQEIREVLSHLSQTLDGIRGVEGLDEVLTETQKKRLKYAGLELATSVIKYLLKAMQYLKDASAVKFAKGLLPTTTAEFDAAKTEVGNAAKRYADSMGYLTVNMMARTLSYVEKQERANLLKWLWGGDYWGRHLSFRQKRAHGTGTWLNSDWYKEWRNGMAPPILICLGMPGAGKSFIMSLIVDRLLPLTNSLSTQKVGVAQFYFEDKDRDQQRAENFIRSLLKQLVHHMDKIPNSIEEAYHQVQTSGLVAEPGLAEFLELLKQCFAKFSNVFVLLDAFDECAEGERAGIMRALRSLPESKLRLFITCRTPIHDYPHISHDRALKEWLTKAVVKQIMARKEDVEIFLRERIRTDARLDADETMKEKIITAIVSKMDGQFLLADFQLRELFSHVTQRRELESALENLPIKLDILYEKIMADIDKRETRTAKNLALRTLSWMFYTPRPLRAEELCELLAIKEGDDDLVSMSCFLLREDIQNVCHGLVTFDDATGIIRFSHFTIQEFFRGYDSLCSVNELAKICLTYLSFKVFEQEGPCDNNDALNARLKKYGAASYIADSWGYYIGQAQDSQEIVKAVVSLLRSQKKRDAIAELAESNRNIFISGRAMMQAIERRKGGFTGFVSGQTMMHILAANGLTTICRTVLKESSNLCQGQNITYCVDDLTEEIMTEDSSGLTPFEYATMKGHKETAMMLLEWGARLERRGEEGRTVLATAVEFQNLEMTVALVQLGADVHARDEYGRTTLHLAALSGQIAKPGENEKIIHTLLNSGANIDAIDADGKTALLCAMEVRNKEAAIVLLERGANIHITWEGDHSALHSAAAWGNKDVVFKLLDMGADINAINDQGQSVLHCAVQRRVFSESEPNAEVLVQELLKRGADRQIIRRDRYGRIAWFSALGDEAMEVILLDAFSALLKSVCSSPGVQSNTTIPNFPENLGCQLERLSKLSVDSPSDLIYLNLVGFVCWQVQEYDMGIAAYERALRLDPVNESITNIDEFSHMYTQCAICFNKIIGIRLRCRNCDDFDLCGVCSIERVGSHPSDHFFVSIPMDKSARKAKVKNYVDVLDLDSIEPDLT